MANKLNNNDRRYWMFKAPLELKMQLDRIRLERIKQGKDRQMKSYKRLGLGIARHPQLVRDLTEAEMKEDFR